MSINTDIPINFLTAASGVALPNRPLWNGIAKSIPAFRWRAAVEEVALDLYGRCAGGEKQFVDPAHRHDYRYGPNHKMLHALAAKETAWRSGMDHDGWDRLYPSSVAEQADRICLGRWVGMLGGAVMTKDDADKQINEALIDILQSVLLEWSKEAWSDVVPNAELVMRLSSYTHLDVMGESGRQPWAEAQDVVQAFLEGWLDSACVPGSPNPGPPKWLNSSIIRLQLVGAAEADRLRPALVIVLDDWIQSLRRTPRAPDPWDDPNELIPLCRVLGDRARLEQGERESAGASGERRRKL